ncbi:cyclin-like protein [Blastocladiella britannica]|nr:cyclin-like protein [Blastocladiella britannica]
MTAPGSTDTASAVPPSVHENSSQYKHWRFAPQQLADLRRAANAAAITDARESIQREAELSATVPPSSIDFLSPDEEYEMLNFVLVQLVPVCKKLKLGPIIRATAIMFMKRFYVYKSVMDYPLKEVMATCVFLAAKVESSFVDLTRLVESIKGLSKSYIKELEFTVCDVLKYQFWVWHPIEAAQGIYLDVQKSNPKPDLSLLDTTKNETDMLLGQIVCTDAVLVYLPSQISLACWWRASEKTGFPFEQAKHRYLTAPDKLPADVLEDLKPRIHEILAILDAHTIPNKERAAQLSAKLRACRNPASSPDTKLYAHVMEERRKREMEEEEREMQAETRNAKSIQPASQAAAAGTAVKRTAAEANLDGSDVQVKRERLG